MTFQNYLPAIAIIISTASFIISFTTAKFNRRVKSVELMSNVYIKISDTSNNIFELLEFFHSAQSKAEELNDVTMFKDFDRVRISELHKRFKRINERLTSYPSGHGLEIYESFFHDIHELNGLVSSLRASSHKRYEEHLERIKLNQSPKIN